MAAAVFLFPTAVLIGDVVGERAGIWFRAVLRADFGRIAVGRGSPPGDRMRPSATWPCRRAAWWRRSSSGRVVAAPETVVAGVPAQVKRPLSGNARRWVANAAREYRQLRLRYLGRAV